jgi:hypothetical protein
MTVTIDASDASGNPLAGVGLAATTPIPNAPLDAGANLADLLGYSPTDDSVATSWPLVPSVQPAAVPEPSTLLIFAVGALLLAVAVFRRHPLRRSPIIDWRGSTATGGERRGSVPALLRTAYSSSALRST